MDLQPRNFLHPRRISAMNWPNQIRSWLKRLVGQPEPDTAYYTDWPYRFLIIPLAQILEGALGRIASITKPAVHLILTLFSFETSESKEVTTRSKSPHWLSVGVVLVLAVPGVATIAGLYWGEFLPKQGDSSTQILEDSRAVIIAIIYPIAGTLAYNFYSRIGQTFQNLQRRNVLQGLGYHAWRSLLHRRLNMVKLQVFFIPLVIWVARSIPIGQADYYETIPRSIVLYMHIWVVGIGNFASLEFGKKLILTALSIQRLAKSQDPWLEPQAGHSDGGSGLTPLTDLWIGALLVGVLLDINVITMLLLPSDTPEFIVIPGIAIHFLVTSLFIRVAFWPIHELMKKKKKKKKKKEIMVDRHFQEWQIQKEILSERMLISRQNYKDALELPTWPIKRGMRELILGLVLLPPAITLVISVVGLLD